MASAQAVDPDDPDGQDPIGQAPDGPIRPGGPAAPRPPVGPGAPVGPIAGPSGATGSRFIPLAGLKSTPLSPDSREDDPIQASQGGGFGESDGGYKGPVWSALSGRWSELNDSDLDLAVATIGGDVWANESTIFGLMLQGDIARQDGPGDELFESTGYMLGVYGIYQIDHLSLDARVLLGQASTDIEDTAGAADDVKSDRWLASVQASSPIELANGSWLIPRLSIGWVEDQMEAYTLGATEIAAQTVAYGQADVGANFLKPVTLGEFDGSLSLGAAGIWIFGDDAGTQIPEELRARFDVGLEIYGGEDWSFSGKVFSDGFGSDEYNAVGVDLGVMIWF